MNEPQNRAFDRIDHFRAQWQRELPDLDTEPMAVLGRMYRLSNLVRPGIEATFAEFGLDRGEFDVVSTLLRSGPPYRLTPTELYSSLMISSGGLTHRLDRLVKAGLVERGKSPSDGRVSYVTLTEEGRSRTEAAFRRDMANEADLLGGIDPEKRAALSELLRELMLAVEGELQCRNDGRMR